MDNKNVKAIQFGDGEPFRVRKKKYLKELEEIKEFYNPKKYRKVNKHKDWKDDWKGFVEYTYPWDGENILTMIVYRLEVLAANLKYFGHHVSSDEEVKEITKVVNLGRKLLDDDNYRLDSRAYRKKHCKSYAYVYKDERELGKSFKKSNLLAKLEAEIGESEPIIDRWLKANNLTYKDVHVSYGAEWDRDDSSKVWLDLIKSENDEMQSDRRRFFASLADNLSRWWD